MASVVLKRVCPLLTKITAGTSLEKPSLGDTCSISISDLTSSTIDLAWVRGTADTSEYLNNAFCGEVKISEGDTTVDRQIEEALLHMWVGETSKLELSIQACEFKYVLRSHSGSLPQLLDVSMIITLNSVTKGEELWMWNKDKLMGEAAISKLRGNELFCTKRTVDAFFRYSVAAKYLGLVDQSTLSDDDKKDLKVQLAAVRNNIACVHQMFDNYEEVVYVTSLVLSEFPDNVKAMLRHAAASIKLQEYETAEEDLKFVLKLEPQNKDAPVLLKELAQGKKDCSAKLALGMKKMFK